MKKLLMLVVVFSLFTSLVSSCYSESSVGTTAVVTTATSSSVATTTPINSTIAWSLTPFPTVDFTETDVTEWMVSAEDHQVSTVSSDINLVKVGTASIKIQTKSGSDVNLRYALPPGKYWDLSSAQDIHFWVYTENPSPAGFQNASPWIKLTRADNSYIRYQSEIDILNGSRNQWQEFKIPLSGDNIWKSSSTGSDSLTKITGLEIHADTWDYGFTMWVDGLRFEPYSTVTSTVTSISQTSTTTTKTLLPTSVNVDSDITFPMIVPVLIVKYFPVSNGNIDISVTGDVSMPLVQARTRTDELTTGIIKAMEDGSRYHYYKDAFAQPSLSYQIVGTLEYLEPLPTLAKVADNAPMTDYNQIMARINAEDWVMNKGVKEIWIWGYHGGKVGLWESNMSSPYGDVSNSSRDPNDLPIFQKTYTVYHYNYQRGVSEAVEDHMHQNEAIFRSINNDLFWNKFVGKVGEGRCGWSHYPPNAVKDYDWQNHAYIWTDIEDWKPDGSGQKVNINCTRWNSDSLTWFEYWMQSYPGKNNTLYDGTKKISNWWIFIGEYDKCKVAGINLEN